MILNWNYTLEAFFWIIVLGIALVSLTIFFASPRNKPRSLVDLEKLDGEITETEQYAKKESGLDYDVLEPKDEDAEFEAFVESLPSPLQAIISIRLVIGMMYGVLIVVFGFIDLEISNENYGSVPNLMVFFTSIFAGVAFTYGLYLDSRAVTKSAARLIAIYCLFLLPVSSGLGLIDGVVLACVALTYSNDLIWVWKFLAHGNPVWGGDIQTWYRFLLFLLLIAFFWLPIHLGLIGL